MTPKQRANNLVDDMISTSWMELHIAKKCAIVAVDYILDFIDIRMQGWLDADWISYWHDVKKEIQKL